MYFLLKEIENEKGLVLNLHIPWTWPLGDIRFYLYNRTEIVLKFPQVLALSQMKTIQTTYCTLFFFLKRNQKGFATDVDLQLPKMSWFWWNVIIHLPTVRLIVLCSEVESLCYLWLVTSLWRQVGKLALWKMHLRWHLHITICLLLATSHLWKKSSIQLRKTKSSASNIWGPINQ